MKVEIGEYVRTKAGDITKITRFCELEFNGVRINSIVGEDGCLFGNPDKVVKKHSKNIIDLIEPGDYVNGVEVIDLADGIHLEFANDVSFVDVGLASYTDGHVEGIETIVTKQQFSNMEYRV
jgi:hypothetical protein